MKYIFTLLVFAFSVAIPSSAATDYYLVTPFTGTTTKAACGSSLTHIQVGSETEIPDEISSFTFGGTDPASALGAGGKVTRKNFVISKVFDNGSAPLITAFLTGQQIPTVTIYAAKIGEYVVGAPTTATPYLTITLKNVTISQYTLTGASENHRNRFHWDSNQHR